MDQQHPFNPATGHPDIHAGEASLPEARGTPALTVLFEGEWLDGRLREHQILTVPEASARFLPPAPRHRKIQKDVFIAIYHLRLAVVQRSTGQSVVAFTADRARARVRLHDGRPDRMQAPRPAKRGTMPILSKVLLPDGAPACWHNREMLWNEVEVREHRRDANLAREVEFALPAELLPHQATALARDYMRMAFVSEGMAADLNVQRALQPDGQPKPYAQVLLTMRRIGAEGFGFKERA